jgi:hypothetical protein
MRSHGGNRSAHILFRISAAQRQRLGQCHAVRHVAVERVVR